MNRLIVFHNDAQALHAMARDTDRLMSLPGTTVRKAERVIELFNGDRWYYRGIQTVSDTERLRGIGFQAIEYHTALPDDVVNHLEALRRPK